MKSRDKRAVAKAIAELFCKARGRTPSAPEIQAALVSKFPKQNPELLKDISKIASVSDVILKATRKRWRLGFLPSHVKYAVQGVLQQSTYTQNYKTALKIWWTAFAPPFVRFRFLFLLVVMVTISVYSIRFPDASYKTCNRIFADCVRSWHELTNGRRFDRLNAQPVSTWHSAQRVISHNNIPEQTAMPQPERPVNNLQNQSYPSVRQMMYGNSQDAPSAPSAAKMIYGDASKPNVPNRSVTSDEFRSVPFAPQTTAESWRQPTRQNAQTYSVPRYGTLRIEHYNAPAFDRGAAFTIRFAAHLGGWESYSICTNGIPLGKLGDLSKAKTFNLPVGRYRLSFLKGGRSLLGLVPNAPMQAGSINIQIRPGETNTVLIDL